MDMLLLALSLPLMLAVSSLLDTGTPEEDSAPAEDDDDALDENDVWQGETLGFLDEAEPDSDPSGDVTAAQHLATAQQDDFPGGSDADDTVDGFDDFDEPPTMAKASVERDDALPGGSDDSEDHSSVISDDEPDDLAPYVLLPSDLVPIEPAGVDHSDAGASGHGDEDPESHAADDPSDDPLADSAADETGAADGATPENPALWSEGDPPVDLLSFDPETHQIAIDLTDPQGNLTTIPSLDGADTEVQLNGETILVLRGFSADSLPSDAVTNLPGLVDA